MSKIYDVILVGSGPTNAMAALKFIDNKITNILMLEKGILRPRDGKVDVTSGILGSGPWSDSKINLTHKVGGTVHEVIGMTKYYQLLDEQKNIWLKFAPTDEQKTYRLNYKPSADIESRLFEPSPESSELRTKALAFDMDLDVYPILHLGTDNSFDICSNIYAFILNNGIEVKTETTVTRVTKKNEIFNVETDKGNFQAKHVVIAPGRSGGALVQKIAKDNNIKLQNNGIDIGIRLECPQEIGDAISKYKIYEPKAWKYSGKSQTRVRSFCYCPQNAFVVEEEYRDTGIVCVNGHSFSSAGASSGNMNFAVLATTTFTSPFENAMHYAESVARNVNALAGGKSLMQRFGDLKLGRRSTHKKIREGATVPTLDAEPGALDLALPHRQLDAIIDFIDTLGNIIPAVNSAHSLLYSPEIKFFSNKVPMNKDLSSPVKGLWFGGDASGMTRGINMSSVSGLQIAESIMEDLK